MNHSDYENMVDLLFKSGTDVLGDLTPLKVSLWHASSALCGEAGELFDPIKKHVIYGKPLDRENVIEELGDMEFYMEAIRWRLDISRDECLEANMSKLRKRYPDGYTDQSAIERKDKQ